MWKEYVAGVWQASSEPVFYSLPVFAEALSHWYEDLQVCLLFRDRILLSEVAIGYEVAGDIRDYLFNYALPDLLSLPVRLTIPVNVSGGKAAIAYTLTDRLIESAQFKPDGKAPVAATVKEGICTTSVEGRGILSLFIRPRVEYSESQMLFQISDLPTVLIRRLQLENVRYPHETEDYFQGSALTRTWSTYLYDQRFEVLVIAPNEAIASLVSKALHARILGAGGIYLKKFGINVPLVLDSGIEIDQSDRLVVGGLPKATFQAIAKNIVECETA
jgi:hypothetical protein